MIIKELSIYRMCSWFACGMLVSCAVQVKESTKEQKHHELERLYRITSTSEESNPLAYGVQLGKYLNIGIRDWSPQDHPNVAEYTAQLAKKYGVNALYMQSAASLPSNSAWLDVVGDRSIPKTKKANEFYERMRKDARYSSPFTTNYYLTDSFR